MPSEMSVRCMLSAGKYNSFTKAAEELYMTRQAVSRQIGILEGELGCRLFERTTAGIALTPVGKVYLDFFVDAEKRWKDTQQQATEILDKLENTINIGLLCDSDMGKDIFRLIERCKTENEHVLQVNLERREPNELIGLLINGRLDVVFIFDECLEAYRDSDIINYTQFSEAEAVLVVRSDHPLISSAAVAQDFQTETCFISAQMNSRDSRKLSFSSEWELYGMNFREICVVANRESVHSMVELGRGVTISLSTDRFSKSLDLVTYPLGRKIPILCIWRKQEKRPQIRRFLHVLQDNF